MSMVFFVLGEGFSASSWLSRREACFVIVFFGFLKNQTEVWMLTLCLVDEINVEEQWQTIERSESWFIRVFNEFHSVFSLQPDKRFDCWCFDSVFSLRFLNMEFKNSDFKM